MRTDGGPHGPRALRPPAARGRTHAPARTRGREPARMCRRRRRGGGRQQPAPSVCRRGPDWRGQEHAPGQVAKRAGPAPHVRVCTRGRQPPTHQGARWSGRDRANLHARARTCTRAPPRRPALTPAWPPTLCVCVCVCGRRCSIQKMSLWGGPMYTGIFEAFYKDMARWSFTFQVSLSGPCTPSRGRAAGARVCMRAYAPSQFLYRGVTALCIHAHHVAPDGSLCVASAGSSGRARLCCKWLSVWCSRVRG